MYLKRFIMNLFIDLKNRLFILLDNDVSLYTSCLHEIMEVLQVTLSQMEGIYYKYILFPKLQGYYTSNIS